MLCISTRPYQQVCSITTVRSNDLIGTHWLTRLDTSPEPPPIYPTPPYQWGWVGNVAYMGEGSLVRSPLSLERQVTTGV